MKAQSFFYFVGVIALTILIFNNVGQAVSFYGFSLNNKMLNWLAIISLLIAAWYFVFKKM